MMDEHEHEQPEDGDKLIVSSRSQREEVSPLMIGIDSQSDTTLAQLTDRDKIFAILASSSGNLVEWFDFYIYAFT